MTHPAAPADLQTSMSAPRVMNVDMHAAYPKAMADHKACTGYFGYLFYNSGINCVWGTFPPPL